MKSEIESMAKYLWSLAALFSVLGLAWSLAWTVSADQVAAFAPNAAIVDATPVWKTERLTPDPQTGALPASALSPIYPATPGKELLGKVPFASVRTARPHNVIAQANAQARTKKQPAENPVHQAMRADRLPRQIYAARAEETEDDLRRPLGYAAEPLRQLRPTRSAINLVHGIY